MKKRYLKRINYLATSILMLIYYTLIGMSSTYAIDTLFFSQNDILFYKPEYAFYTGNSCTSLLTPTINDTAGLARIIDNYIESNSPESPFKGMGSDFVDGAVSQGLNPFIGVLHSQKESNFAAPMDIQAWHNYTFNTSDAASSHNLSQKVESYNSFGRSATPEQPNAWYPTQKGPRLVYKWKSYKDSLIGEDSFYAYYKRLWIEEKGFMSFDEIIKEYAPASDGNNVNAYTSFMNQGMNKLITLAGSTISCGGGFGQGGEGGSNTGNREETIDLKYGYYIKKSMPTMVYFNQADSRWQNEDVYKGEFTFADCGCFPTSMAMAINTVGPNKNITPLDVGRVVASKNGTHNGCGYNGSDDWPIINLADEFKVNIKLVNDVDEGLNGIKNGGLVVVSVNAKEFTKWRHYIVLRGETTDGKVAIANSSNIDQTFFSSYDKVSMENARTLADGRMWLVSGN